MLALVRKVAHERWPFLLLLNVVMIVFGVFLEHLLAMVLSLPAEQAYGVDPVPLALITYFPAFVMAPVYWFR